MADINQMMVNRAVASAERKEKATISDEIKMQRAMIRYELETNELLQELITTIRQNNNTIAQIGMPAIKEYIKQMRETMLKKAKATNCEEKLQKTETNAKI